MKAAWLFLACVMGSALILTTFVTAHAGTVVGFWHMDEGSGSTMRDSSGNGNNGSIIPYVGIAMLVPAWLTAVGIPAFKFIAKLEYPLSLAGPVVAGWYLIGLVYLFYSMSRTPNRIRDTGRVFVEEAVG